MPAVERETGPVVGVQRAYSRLLRQPLRRRAESSPQPPWHARSTVDRTEGISHTGFHAGSFSVRDETRAVAETVRRRVRIMSATLHPTLPHHEPVAPPAARLALKTDGTSRGLLDGAWWPRSRDLLS